jgi:hypothetical protein
MGSETVCMWKGGDDYTLLLCKVDLLRLVSQQAGR